MGVIGSAYSLTISVLAIICLCPTVIVRCLPSDSYPINIWVTISATWKQRKVTLTNPFFELWSSACFKTQSGIRSMFPLMQIPLISPPTHIYLARKPRDKIWSLSHKRINKELAG